MFERKSVRPFSAVKVLLVILASLVTAFSAENTKIQGVIKGRSGATMTVQTSDSPKLVVMLTDETKVSQIEGAFKVRRKSMSMAALIPGLIVNVEGTFNADKQLVASSVKFKGDDLKQAKAIQGGMYETRARTDEQQKELERQNEALAKQQQSLEEEQKKVAANKAEIDAATARFGQLDDYYILHEVTVHFANGKTALTAEYKPKLLELAEKAKTVPSYMVQVIGYASSTGNEELNQKLSEDRAHSVVIFLSQQGHIPLTNMLAPGAMGESRQVGNAATAEGQAENRRVLARVLQNKGIAGSSATAP